MKTPKEFLKSYGLPDDLWLNGVSIEYMLNEYSNQVKTTIQADEFIKQPSPEESAAQIKQWNDVMTSANEVMSMFEKKPTRAELLKEIEELKALQVKESEIIEFDLEKSLNGAKLVTRSGLPVSEIKRMETAKNDFKIIAVVDGEIYCYNGFGRIDSKDHTLDLFMVPRTVTKWVNVYPNNVHETEQQALNHLSPGCIATIEVTLNQ